MLQLNNIKKIYHAKNNAVEALSATDLAINEGEIFGVIGESGAGKSTLIRCVNLLEAPTEGTVHIAGQSLTQLDKSALRVARQNIGMIFQHFNLLSSRTVRDNIALPLEITRKPAAEINETIQPLLQLTGLSEKQHQYPSQLSGGQKQRVAIARALVHKPRVLLCDECTSALDPQTTQSILKLLKDINQQFNITILLITHEMEVIKSICDRVAVLEKGKIVECEPVLQFFKQPKTDVAKSMLQSTLKHDLPDSFRKIIEKNAADNCAPVWRIWFSGGATTKPLIAELLQHYSVSINILQANIEYIHGEATGIMLASVDGEESNIAKGHQFLTEKNIMIETIGYVNRNNITTL